ncbi:MAG: hypothetical protein ACE366_16620 [Bradymonadia bacterium]
MNITLITTDGHTFHCTLPNEGAKFVYLGRRSDRPVNHLQPERCPCCGSETPRIQGQGPKTITDRDAQDPNAVCFECGEHVGTLHVVFDTIFGLEEDRALISGRCRVY